MSYNKIGDVQAAQGDLAGALKSYRDGLAIADRLARESDPGNAELAARSRSVAREDRGHAPKRWGNGTEALAALRRGHAIMVHLTALSPDNVIWKSDLAWFSRSGSPNSRVRRALPRCRLSHNAGA